ncbi:MAG TPA: MarR family transcriptional regulator [Vicinamibacterales bacterium]|jgi:DNA-binding MarR family transcriptional regulator|nr:MarR family transcriptional regulator [Vicinamibacterales bacterium]
MTSTKVSADRLEIADRLHSAAIHLLRLVRGQDENSGLSPARLSALSVVVFAGPVTLGRLASAEQVTAPTMTRLVAALEADGLISRKDDTEDRRVVWLSATAKGKKILQEGRRRRVHALAGALSALNAEELTVLSDAAALMNRVTATPDERQRPRRLGTARAR